MLWANIYAMVQHDPPLYDPHTGSTPDMGGRGCTNPLRPLNSTIKNAFCQALFFY